MVRVIFDTNVLIDGFSDDFSAQAQLLEAVQSGKITALLTGRIEREYRLILNRLNTNPQYRQKIENFLQQAELVSEQRVAITIDDPDDYKFLQAAVGGQADLIITMDRHLLSAGEIGETRIVTPHEALSMLEEESNTNDVWKNFVKGFGIGVLLLAALLQPTPSFADDAATTNELATTTQAIADKQTEITALDEKINTLRHQATTTANEAAIISQQIKRLSEQLNKAQLELKQTELSITSTETAQKNTEKNIINLQQEVSDQKEVLSYLIRELNQSEQASWVSVFLSNWSLSAVLAERATYAELQTRTTTAITTLRDKEKTLTERKAELAEQARALQNLHGALASQQTELDEATAEQKKFLTQKKEEQVKYQRQLAEAKQARAEIEQNVFTLKSSAVKVTLTDAKDRARYAARLTGVRAALLMAVLKVESNLGGNVGSGTFPDDMHPLSRDAFLRLTKKLGLDPATAPISRRPRSFQGWGGAMGPGQFMPDTWERMEEQIGKLVGHVPNPYDLTDAFVATGLFLANYGAVNQAQEHEAVNHYIAGPNWRNFTWYGDRVLAVAKEYAAEGI